jgi:hypothetical protein
VARTEHRPSGKEAAYLAALEAVAQHIEEADAVRADLIRKAREAGATWKAISTRGHLAIDTVRRLAEG